MCVGMCPRAECIIMNISEESEYEVLALKEELIPNFNLLDHQVQVELINILDTILAQPPKKTIQ